MWVQYGNASETTLKIKSLISTVSSIGVNPDVTIDNCLSILSKIENDFSDIDDVFVTAARNLLGDICEDGKLSESEKSLLANFASVFENPVSNEPICGIQNKAFVLTGDFEISGGKGTVKSLIKKGGGTYKEGVSKKVDYVVVGGLGSDAWAFGNFGTKVKKALDLKLSKGANLEIVTEKSFFDFVMTGNQEDAALCREELSSIDERFNKQSKSTRVVSKDFTGLTDGQERTLQAVKDGKNVYLTGLGGTGKSYILERIIEWAQGEEKNVIVCAPTGIAALNIGGTTIHNALGIRPEKTLSGNSSPWIKPDSPLITCDLMIVDEISMCRADLFDYLSRALKSASKLRQDTEPICQLIVVGDFCQLPPVLTKDDRPLLEQKYSRDIGHGYPFMGDEWDSWDFHHIELVEAIRQRDIDFVNALNACRIGNTSGLKWIEEHASPSPRKNAIVLCGRNETAESINRQNLNKLTTPEFKYFGTKHGEVEAGDISAPITLVLRSGARVMALANMSNETYMNGSIGTVTECFDNYVEVCFDNGNTVDVHTHTWDILKPIVEDGKSKYETIGTYTQIPLKLAYAITIHKSQGQTFDAASIYPECWEPGQLYTALSRLTTIEGLHLAHHCADSFLIAAPEVIDFYESFADS